MSPAFLVNYVTGRRQQTKTKVDRWSSLVFFPDKIEGVKTQNEHFIV
jgi:hypothetical protein